MVKAGIVGGTGYTGVELLRLLAQHPRVELKAITSRKEAGTPVAAMFPSLRRRVELAFLPLVEAGVVDLDHLVADAKSGVSGAGRKADLHLSFSEAADNFMAYNVPGHRHWPEIRQGLAQAAKREVGLVFTAHLTPLIRGIHATLYGRITREVDFQSLFEKRYAGEPFVDVMPAGSHPDTRSVRAANICRIAVHRPPESARRADTLVVLSVIDNLVKGASGQAVQNMNLMFGLPEAEGLGQVPVVP